MQKGTLEFSFNSSRSWPPWKIYDLSDLFCSLHYKLWLDLIQWFPGRNQGPKHWPCWGMRFEGNKMNSIPKGPLIKWFFIQPKKINFSLYKFGKLNIKFLAGKSNRWERELFREKRSQYATCILRNLSTVSDTTLKQRWWSPILQLIRTKYSFRFLNFCSEFWNFLH